MKSSRKLIEFGFWRIYLEICVFRLKAKILPVRVENCIPHFQPNFSPRFQFSPNLYFGLNFGNFYPFAKWAYLKKIGHMWSSF